MATASVTAATEERRLSEERLPGEPGPSTDDGRPWPADTATSLARAPQRHHRHYRSDSRRPPQREQRQQQACSTTAYTADTATDTTTDTAVPDMITVAASGSRAARPKSRPRVQSPSTLFPVDVADRMQSLTASSDRPRQYGRRRSVQDAVASAVALRRQERLQLQATVSVAVTDDDDAAAEPDTDEQLRASSADREQEQEPRLVAPLRLVRHRHRAVLITKCCVVHMYKKTHTCFLTYSAAFLPSVFASLLLCFRLAGESRLNFTRSIIGQRSCRPETVIALI